MSPLPERTVDAMLSIAKKLWESAFDDDQQVSDVERKAMGLVFHSLQMLASLRGASKPERKAVSDMLDRMPKSQWSRRDGPEQKAGLVIRSVVSAAETVKMLVGVKGLTGTLAAQEMESVARSFAGPHLARVKIMLPEMACIPNQAFETAVVAWLGLDRNLRRWDAVLDLLIVSGVSKSPRSQRARERMCESLRTRWTKWRKAAGVEPAGWDAFGAPNFLRARHAHADTRSVDEIRAREAALGIHRNHRAEVTTNSHPRAAKSP